MLFLNAYNGLPTEIQKRVKKVFNEVLPGKHLGTLMVSGDEYNLRQGLKRLDEDEMDCYVKKLIDEEVIDYEN